MNKKNLIVILVILAIILLACFFGFKYFNNQEINVQSYVDQEATIQPEQNLENSPAPEQPVTNNNPPQVQISPPVVTEKKPVSGGLSVCVDECGNGVCQKTDPECKDNMNCICSETPQECPQDCK